MELLAIKLEGKKEDIQWTQFLVPLRRLSLNKNVCGLRRCVSDGYSDENPPLDETIFLDTWDIIGSKD
jgi:hypothetical protein